MKPVGIFIRDYIVAFEHRIHHVDNTGFYLAGNKLSERSELLYYYDKIITNSP